MHCEGQNWARKSLLCGFDLMVLGFVATFRLTVCVVLVFQCWKLSPPLQREVGHLSSALIQHHTPSAKQDPLQLNRTETNLDVTLQTRISSTVKRARSFDKAFIHSLQFGSAHQMDTHLQQLTALSQSTLFSWRARFHVADKDPHSISSHDSDIISQTGSSMFWWGGGTWRWGAEFKWQYVSH